MEMDTSAKVNARVAVAAVLMISLMVAGCAATRGRRGEPEKSGFLRNYSQLQKNPDYPAALVYVKPGVTWSRYNAVQLDSVGLWVGAGTDLSSEDQQRLTDTLYTAVYSELGKYFTLTREAGPSTVRLRVALTQAQGAKPGLRTVTTVVPQLRLLGSVVGLAGDPATTVGSATVEMEVLDSATNQRLAAAVDARAGTKVLFAKRSYTTWGDVETACQYWAKRLAWQLARHGVQRKPGAGMPEEPGQDRTI